LVRTCNVRRDPVRRATFSRCRSRRFSKMPVPFEAIDGG
jgi:hypothetical protein